jgi:hypothetical protein
MRYLVRFSVEVEIESDARNDLGVVADAEQSFNTKVRPLHVEPMRDE